MYCVIYINIFRIMSLFLDNSFLNLHKILDDKFLEVNKKREKT